MLQNPLVMQQMKVMMQDPNVKARMQRMLSKLGEDSGMDPSLQDPAMLDKLFERMQDPEMLEKLESHTKNESFVARMQQLAANPKFASAATGYVEDMAQELAEERRKEVSRPQAAVAAKRDSQGIRISTLERQVGELRGGLAAAELRRPPTPPTRPALC